MAIHPALMNFEGYGGRGRLLFVGLEERNPGDDPANLEARETFSRRMDLRAASTHLFGPAFWGSKAQAQQPVWRTASKLVKELGGFESWTHVRDHVLGRTGSETLLAELLPVPLNETGEWPPQYRQQIGFADYYADYLPKMIGTKARPGVRLSMLRRIIKEDEPEYVFCYGSTFLGHFKRLFPTLGGRDWATHMSSPEGYKPQKFHVARVGTTRIAVTRHYSSSRPRAFGDPDIPALLRAFA